MKINTQLHREPLSDKVGQKILNLDKVSILDLDQQAIIDLFKSSGVLLFRGFEADVNTFTEFSNSLSTNFLDYSGGVFNRRVINNNQTVLSVNDFKDEIKLHGEMYYQKIQPLMLWFFCATPPVEKGETIICDAQQFFKELSESMKVLFNQKKLKYVSYWNKEGWQKRYKTTDLKVVKETCANNGTQVKVNEDESINLEYMCPAIYPSRDGNHPTFIGSLLPAKKIDPNIVNFDDGSEITDDIMSELYQIGEKITTEIAWQKGDILMIDNTRIMHGRRTIIDDQRDIYIRLCSPSFPF